jgi:hypothetical protein
MNPRQYWIGVVAKNHVDIGVAGGFTQVNHGKAGPLERMHPGDGFASTRRGPPIRTGRRCRHSPPSAASATAKSSRLNKAKGFVRFAVPSSTCLRVTRRSSRSSTICHSSAANSTGARRSGSASCAFRKKLSRASRPRWDAIATSTLRRGITARRSGRGTFRPTPLLRAKGGTLRRSSSGVSQAARVIGARYRVCAMIPASPSPTAGRL